MSNRPEWHTLGLCAQTDPEIFFPAAGESTRPAKKVCMDCPVQQQCLDYALANEPNYGIYGGLSPTERKRLKRGQRIRQLPKCGTVAAFQAHVRHGEKPCAACRDAKNDHSREWTRAHRGHLRYPSGRYEVI